jgi:hypothetical protein
MGQALHAFKEELRAEGVDHPRFGVDETLWEYLHQAELELWSRQNHLLTPVLVFDQFEEMFTLGRPMPTMCTNFTRTWPISSETGFRAPSPDKWSSMRSTPRH